MKCSGIAGELQRYSWGRQEKRKKRVETIAVYPTVMFFAVICFHS